MAEDGFAMGYALGQDSNGGGGGGNNGGGMFNGDAFWGIILLALLFGGRGFGGFGGGGNGGGGGTDTCCCVQNAVSEGFALNNITDGIRGIQQGICDSTYALNNSIMGGFHGVDNAICTLGYQNQQGFSNLGYAIKDCCCETQRAIDGVNYNIASQFCNLGNTIQSTTRDIIDNQNANYRGIMDFLVQSKIDKLQSENDSLRLRASQADQNAVIRAAIDASTAEIIRRTGNDCPVPSYLVQPPTPVNFPINGCGTVQFGHQGNYGNSCGCGCGCG